MPPKIKLPEYVIAAIRKHCENPESSPNSIRKIALATGFKPNLLYERTRDMGYHRFSYQKFKPWADEEIKIVEDNRHKCYGTIRYHLEKAGYKRSLNAVKNYIIRNKIYWNNGDKLTVSQAAEGMGVSHDSVSSWIRKGYLKAEKTELKFIGDTNAYLIKVSDFRKFLIKYKGSHNFKKVDQCFIIDVLTRQI